MPGTPQSGAPQPDPFRKLSWLDRRRWSRRARRIVREFEAETLSGLRSLAGSGAELVWIAGLDANSARSSRTGSCALAAGLTGPVEFSAGGKRVVAAAVWAPAWESLVAAWRGAAVTLAGAGRYHNSWVLKFRVGVTTGTQAGAVREFVLLASRVRLHDHWGGLNRDGGLFGPPLAPAGAA